MGEIIAYIDDDTVLTPNWVEAILKGFKNEWQMAGGQVEPIFEKEIPYTLKGFERLIGGFNYLPAVGYSTKKIIGCNMFFNRQALIDNGRHVIRFDLKNNVVGGLKEVIKAIKE